MTTFTNDQIALQAHIEAENAAFNAQCEANGATWWTTTVSDPAHWEEYGITTIEGYERHCLISSISDGYKETHGFRPRFMRLGEMSLEELRKTEQDIYDEMREESEREEREAQAEVDAMLKYGAVDIETADRWLRQVH